VEAGEPGDGRDRPAQLSAAGFSLAGTYVLQLSANDGAFGSLLVWVKVVDKLRKVAPGFPKENAVPHTVEQDSLVGLGAP
jgi:hypothetical protein